MQRRQWIHQTQLGERKELEHWLASLKAKGLKQSKEQRRHLQWEPGNGDQQRIAFPMAQDDEMLDPAKAEQAQRPQMERDK